jgi:hypothetical protein
LVAAFALLIALSPHRVGGTTLAPTAPATTGAPDVARVGESMTCVREPYPHATCTIYDPATGTTRTTDLP